MRISIVLALLVVEAASCSPFEGATGGDAVDSNDGGPSSASSDGGPRDGGPGTGDAAPDRIRTIFATEATYDGNLGGVAGADAKCAAEAAKSNHPAVRQRTFRAWVSVLGDPVASRVAQGTLAYVLPTGEGGTLRVAESWASLRLALDRFVEYDQHGKRLNSFYYAWTGSTAEGAATTPNCDGWTASTGEGIVGAAFKTDNAWSAFGPKACAEGARLFCIEE